MSFVSGCSGDEDPTIATPAEFVTQAHQTACSAFFRCDIPGAEAATIKLYLSGVNRCVSFSVGASVLGWGSLEDLEVAVREGKVRYDGAAALRCISRINTTCDVSHPISELCRDVFVGTVANEGMCQRHEECANGGWCDRGQATGMSTCPGVCKPRKRVGETCAVNDECAAVNVLQRAECFPDTSGMSRCTPVRSGSPAGVSMPCGHTIGAAYGLDTPCASGLMCVIAEGALSGSCAQPVAAGMPCSETTACASGSQCLMTTSRMCQPIVVRRIVGERCNPSMREYCDPYARLVCRSSMCVAIGDGTANSTCGNMSVPPSVQCNNGLYCASGRCVTRKDDGMACMIDEFKSHVLKC
jgi:hypothetical protein